MLNIVKYICVKFLITIEQVCSVMLLESALVLCVSKGTQKFQELTSMHLTPRDGMTGHRVFCLLCHI